MYVYGNLREFEIHFSPLVVLYGLDALFFKVFSSAVPQRTAYSEVPSQKAARLRTGSPLQAGEIAGFEPGTAGLQPYVTNNEPPLLPILRDGKESETRRQETTKWGDREKEKYSCRNFPCEK
jgi:hypothetical protein